MLACAFMSLASHHEWYLCLQYALHVILHELVHHCRLKQQCKCIDGYGFRPVFDVHTYMADHTLRDRESFREIGKNLEVAAMQAYLDADRTESQRSSALSTLWRTLCCLDCSN